MGAIRKFFLDDGGSRLTKEGVEELDRYAAGGFSIIRERWPEGPDNLDTFLINYVKALQECPSTDGKTPHGTG